MRKQSRNTKHPFETNPPAARLFKQADGCMSTASPLCDPVDTSSPKFSLGVGFGIKTDNDTNAFIFESHTNGRK